MTNKLFTANSSVKFAQILSSENLAVDINVRAKTASINLLTKTITIPAYSLDLPAAVIESFILHEVSHAKNTPLDLYQETANRKDINSSILNIVEDVRIEKIIKAEYAGAMAIFNSSYNSFFFDKDDENLNKFGIEFEKVNDCHFFDRINISAKVGTMAGVVFSKKEQILVDKVTSTDTFEDVIAVVEELMLFVPKEESKKSPAATPVVHISTDDNTKTDEAAEAEDDAKFTDSTDSTDKNDENGENGENGDSKADDAKSTDSTDENGDSKADDSDETVSNDDFESITQNSVDDNFAPNADDSRLGTYTDQSQINIAKISNAVANSYMLEAKHLSELKDMINGDINKYNQKRNKQKSEILVSYLFSAAKKDCAAMISAFNLHKSAHDLDNTKPFRSGEIDEDQLAFYKTTTDIFKTSQIVGQKTNHLFYNLLDFSGSMTFSGKTECTNPILKGLLAELPDEFNAYELSMINYRAGSLILNVIKQAIAQTMFCKNFNIPIKNVGFCGGMLAQVFGVINNENYAHRLTTYPNMRETLKAGNRFHLINLLDSDMDIKTMKSNVQLIVRSVLCSREDDFSLHFGGTPGSSSIWLSRKFIEEFASMHNPEKIIVNYICDGYSHTDLLDDYRNAFGRTSGALVFDYYSKKYITNIANVGASSDSIPLAVSLLKAAIPNVTFNMFAIAIANNTTSLIINDMTQTFENNSDTVVTRLIDQNSDYDKQNSWKARDERKAFKKKTRKELQGTIPRKFHHPIIDNQFVLILGKDNSDGTEVSSVRKTTAAIAAQKYINNASITVSTSMIKAIA